MTHRFVVRSAAASLSGLLLLGACSDTTRPTAGSATAEAERSATRGGPHGAGRDERGRARPNRLRYRNQGARPATGRSGSATLAAWALLNADGSLALELVTGSRREPDAVAPGNIEKVQVKAYSASGRLLFTRNHAGLAGGGRVTLSYASLAAGTSFHVQANITGIDGRRTDVVTVTARTHRRPDLAVQPVVAPAEVAVNAPVVIQAAVRELNGDVGATASCILLVDGAEVDRIDGQWIDAGGTVGCVFNHTFTTTGPRTLTVRAANVTPGDWDLANNSASATIRIVDAETLLASEGYAQRFVGTVESAEGMIFSPQDALSPVVPQYNRRDYTSDYLYLYGVLPIADEVMSAGSVTITSDGMAIGGAEGTMYRDGSCSFYNDAAGFYFFACTPNEWETGGTFQAGHSAYDATYFSLYYNAFLDAASGEYVHTAPDDAGRDLIGALLPPFGSTIAIDARFLSATNSYKAVASGTMSTTAYDYAVPYSCEWFAASAFGRCYGERERYVARQGELRGLP